MPYFSPSTGGFYLRELHGRQMPADAVKITAKRHAALLEAQAAGATIVAGANGPEAQMPASSIDELRELAARRVKLHARARILAIASLEQQANDAAAIATAALELATIGGASIDFAPALERRKQIDAVRTASNAIELELAGMTGTELAAFRPANSPRWA